MRLFKTPNNNTKIINSSLNLSFLFLVVTQTLYCQTSRREKFTFDKSEIEYSVSSYENGNTNRFYVVVNQEEGTTVKVITAIKECYKEDSYTQFYF